MARQKLADTPENRQRINLYITREIRSRLTEAAARNGTTRNFLVNQAIAEFLKGNP